MLHRMDGTNQYDVCFFQEECSCCSCFLCLGSPIITNEAHHCNTSMLKWQQLQFLLFVFLSQDTSKELSQTLNFNPDFFVTMAMHIPKSCHRTNTHRDKGASFCVCFVEHCTTGNNKLCDTIPVTIDRMVCSYPSVPAGFACGSRTTPQLHPLTMPGPPASACGADRWRGPSA